MITESDEVAGAIDRAAHHFPGESRAEVLRRLVALGARVIDDAELERRDLVRRRAGRHPGVFAPREVELLRDEWPE